MLPEVEKADVVVLGGGLAGMMAAWSAAEMGRQVTLLVRGRPNASEVVGFNVPLLPEDGPDVLFADSLLAGDFAANPHLAAVMAYGIPSTFRYLEEKGLRLRRGDGTYGVRLAADSRVPRTVYYLDETGPLVLHFLRERLRDHRIAWREKTEALAIVTLDGRAAGVLAHDLQSGRLIALEANAVVLTTGGAAGAYRFNTNAEGILGDSYGLALEAGAEVLDMEYVQFEPFIFVHPPQVRGYAVPTTLVTNEGGRVENRLGEECLPRATDGTFRGVTKAAMSRAMFTELRAGRGREHGGVSLDLRHVPEKALAGYPRLLNACRRAGLDPHLDRLEVAPAAHHFMGGVRIGLDACTGIPGLFAAGEAAGGVHGANRMAGNSGPDTLVFGRIAGQSAAQWAPGALDARRRGTDFAAALASLLREGRGMSRERQAALENEVGRLLWEQAGVIRDGPELKDATVRLEALYEEVLAAYPGVLPPGRCLRSLAMTALLVAQGAAYRCESRGAHFRLDYPRRDDRAFLGSIVFRLASGGRIEQYWLALGATEPVLRSSPLRTVEE